MINKTASALIFATIYFLILAGCAKKTPLSTNPAVTQSKNSNSSTNTINNGGGSGGGGGSGQADTANAAPVAVITPTSATVGFAPLHVDLNGVNSSDSDGTIAAYDWDFGDASDAGTGVNVSHVYNTPGTYQVVLRVTDNDGFESPSSPLTITVNSNNQPPVPQIRVQTGTAASPLVIGFDASNSIDPDGSIVNYTWDFGDGTGSTGLTVTHPYAGAGNYTAKLTVTDNSGAQASRTQPLTIAPLPQSSTCTLTLAAPTNGFDVYYYNPLKPTNSGDITATLTISGTTGVLATIGDSSYTLTAGQQVVTRTFKPIASGNLLLSGSVISSINGTPVTNTCSVQFYACKISNATIHGTNVGTISYYGQNYTIMRYSAKMADLDTKYPRFYQINSLAKGINDYHGRAFISFGATSFNHISSFNTASDTNPYSGRDALAWLQPYTGKWGKAECGANNTPSCATNVATGTFSTIPRSLPSTTVFKFEQWTLNGALEYSNAGVYYCK